MSTTKLPPSPNLSPWGAKDFSLLAFRGERSEGGEAGRGDGKVLAGAEGT
jgi:hypothetical protein